LERKRNASPHLLTLFGHTVIVLKHVNFRILMLEIKENTSLSFMAPRVNLISFQSAWNKGDYVSMEEEGKATDGDFSFEFFTITAQF
jgi:hypothetical protein